MSAEAVYLDSSAIVKLIESERESDALRAWLASAPPIVSSGLARVEVLRAARTRGASTTVAAQELLAGTTLIAIDDAILDAAARAEPSVLRSLDAIHLATAQAMGEELCGLVTYDRRLAEAAESAGIPVSAPA